MSMEIVKRLFDAVERKDVDAYVTCFMQDAEYRAGNLPAVFGHDGIREFAHRVIPYFDRVDHIVKNHWQNGDTIISEMDLVYHRKDGKVVSVPCVDIIQVENGKVKSLRAYLDATPAFA